MKSTFTAQVDIKDDINVFVTGNKTEENDHPNRLGMKTHKFESNIPIPSYLFAIVAGNIEQ